MLRGSCNKYQSTSN